MFIAEISPKELRGALTTINQVRNQENAVNTSIVVVEVVWFCLNFVQLMIVMGVSVSFVVGTFLTWRELALVGKTYWEFLVNFCVWKRAHFQETGAGVVPCAVLLVGLSIIPESPRWLVSVSSDERFLVLNVMIEGGNFFRRSKEGRRSLRHRYVGLEGRMLMWEPRQLRFKYGKATKFLNSIEML